MIETQLRSKGIKSQAVLDAFARVPRSEFVPPKYLEEAEADGPLPIGFGQTISQPYIVALMMELLELDKDSKVLDVGTGSGYQAAILAELAGQVYSVEIVPDLAEQAAARLDRLGYRNVAIRVGDGYDGWPEEVPFDAIVSAAAPNDLPLPLVAQLRPGGKMVLPLGQPQQQQLVLVDKLDEKSFRQTSIVPVAFVPMTGQALQ